MFEDADDVKTVSLDEPASHTIRSWCQDSTWVEVALTKPRLSNVDRARVRFSNVLTRVALWVLP